MLQYIAVVCFDPTHSEKLQQEGVCVCVCGKRRRLEKLGLLQRSGRKNKGDWLGRDRSSYKVVGDTFEFGMLMTLSLSLPLSLSLSLPLSHTHTLDILL